MIFAPFGRFMGRYKLGAAWGKEGILAANRERVGKREATRGWGSDVFGVEEVGWRKGGRKGEGSFVKSGKMFNFVG